jgi:hypothetical protein
MRTRCYLNGSALRSLSSAMLSLVFCLISVLTSGSPAWAMKDQAGAKSQDGVDLGLVVKAIENALKESQKHTVRGFPSLTSVTVTLQNTVSKEINGQVKIFVFNIGGGGKADNSASLTFSLKPPPPGHGAGISGFNPQDITNAVGKEIVLAQAGFLEARNTAQSLQTSKVVIEVDFSVSKSINGGVDTGVLLPVGVKAGGTLTRTTGNKITLTYGE